MKTMNFLFKVLKNTMKNYKKQNMIDIIKKK